MIILSPVPKMQFIDNNGIPMANCLVYTYQAGSDSPIATFTDSTGLVNNTNPIILDAGGRASIWLDGNTSYKYVVKNFDGSILYTVDNINSTETSLTINIDTISQLRLIDTTSLITAVCNVAGYYAVNDGGGGTFYFDRNNDQSDDGGMIITPSTGTGRWLREANSEINVLWYGAVNDGITNDATVIQAAANYAKTNNFNLFIPNGSFYIATNPAFGVKVKFAPYGILKWAGYSLPIDPQIEDENQHFICTSTANCNFITCNEIYPEWFGAKGDGSQTSNTNGTDNTLFIQTALDSTPVGGTLVFNSTKKYWCDIINPKAGINLRGSKSFENESDTTPANEFKATLQFIGSGTNFIELQNSDVGGLQGIKIQDLIIDGSANATCIIKLQTESSIIERCTIRNAQYGILFGGNTESSQHNRILNCNFRNLTVAAIANTGDQSRYGIIDDCFFLNCTDDIVLGYQFGWVVHNVELSNGRIDSYHYGESQNYTKNILPATLKASSLITSDGGWADNSNTFSTDSNLWDRKYTIRETAGIAVTSTGIHMGLTKDVTNMTPGTDTHSWYNRDWNGTHHFGDMATEYAQIGPVGVPGKTGIISCGGLNFGGGDVQFKAITDIYVNGDSWPYFHYSTSNKTINWYVDTWDRSFYPSYRPIQFSPIPVPDRLPTEQDVATTVTVTPAIGLLTFTSPSTKSWMVGQKILLSNLAWGSISENSHWCYGTLVSYDYVSGVMVINVEIIPSYSLPISNVHIQSAWPWWWATGITGTVFPGLDSDKNWQPMFADATKIAPSGPGNGIPHAKVQYSGLLY